MHHASTFSSRALQRAVAGFRGFRPAARDRARRFSQGVLLAALISVLISLAGTGAAVATDRPGAPFGGNTVTEFPDPLVKSWHWLREQIRLDDLIVSTCIGNETDDCIAAKKLTDVVDDARQYQGRAMIGHINRSINLMIRPAAGHWMSALDVLKLGSGDCKDYSVAKYTALLRAGISPDRIRLVIVHNNPRRENHMVVSVYDDGHWLLLDNLTMLLVEDTDRKGYLPMFELDETGVRRYIAATRNG